MNYEKIYNDLIQKRRNNKIDKTSDNKNVEYHHIIPRSCDGQDDPRDAAHNNENYNIIGLTLDEHFFAHLLLQRIYKEKYGIKHPYYKHMLKAIQMMIDRKKYKRRTSKLYKKLRLLAFKNGSTITTAGRIWITNGKKDIFLKPGETIPPGFRKGRTIFFTAESKQNFHNLASAVHTGKKSWNSGKRGIYSITYRKKISNSHADVRGENNPHYGSRTMYNTVTKHRVLVQKNDIEKYLNKGYVFAKDLKKFNDGTIEVLDIKCPTGFKPGKLPPKHTQKELEQIHIKRSNAAKKSNANRERNSNGRFK